MDNCLKLILTNNLYSYWEKYPRPLPFIISSNALKVLIKTTSGISTALCVRCVALCFFVHRCVTSSASLFQVFKQWRAEGKKAKERNWERGRFLPLLSLVTTFFSAAFLFTVPTIWTPGIGFFGASRLGCGRKKERQQHYEFLKVTYDQAGFFWNRRDMSLTGMLLHLVHFPGIWSSG